MKAMFRKVANFFGIDKLRRLRQDVKQHGGVGATLWKGYRMDSVKGGRLVGEDKYGNKYYENLYYFMGRSRWVEYAEWRNLEYDGSQVPAEWFGWLHYRTDAPPFADAVKLHAKYKWMLDHSENMSGTKDAYYPYSTTKEKIEAWDPKAK
jgi:NADH dehydrogenase (ubiquinone) 1 alpha subcomplex subunit 12